MRRDLGLLNVSPLPAQSTGETRQEVCSSWLLWGAQRDLESTAFFRILGPEVPSSAKCQQDVASLGSPSSQFGEWCIVGAPKSDACTLPQVSALHTLSSVWGHWACRVLPPWLKEHPQVHEVLMREASPAPCSNSMHGGTPAPSIQRPLCAWPWFTDMVDSSFCVCANADTILSRPPTYSSTRCPPYSWLIAHLCSSLGSPEVQQVVPPCPETVDQLWPRQPSKILHHSAAAATLSDEV